MGGKIIVVALQLPQPVAAEKQSILLSTFFIRLNLLVLSRMATMACRRFFSNDSINLPVAYSAPLINYIRVLVYAGCPLIWPL